MLSFRCIRVWTNEPYFFLSNIFVFLLLQVVEPLSFHKVILYDACIEKWPTHNLKVGFAVCILLVQAVIPASVVTIVHVRIASYLHTHAKSQTNVRRAQRELKRNKKTTILLLGTVYNLFTNTLSIIHWKRWGNLWCTTDFQNSGIFSLHPENIP